MTSGLSQSLPAGTERPPPDKQIFFQVSNLFSPAQASSYPENYAFSGDGRRVAFAEVRSIEKEKDFEWKGIGEDAHTDIWVADEQSGWSRRITDGATDGSGWFNPQWSPSGSRLGFLSTRGGQLSLWLWDGDKAGPVRATHRDLALSNLGFWWIDDNRVMFWADEDHSPSLASARGKDTSIAVAPFEWGMMRKNQGATSSVLDGALDSSKSISGSLVLYDTTTGAERVLARAESHSWQSWALSPDRSKIARLNLEPPGKGYPAPVDQPYADAERYTLDVVDIDSGRVVRTMKNDEHILPGPIRWSADGEEIAFLSCSGSGDYAVQTVSSLRGNRTIKLAGITPVASDRRTPPLFDWLGDAFVVLARRPRENRMDWWRVTKDDSTSCMTCKYADVPGGGRPRGLTRTADGSLVGVSPSGVARFSSSAQLALMKGKELARIWPGTLEGVAVWREERYSSLIVAKTEGERVLLSEVNTGNGRVKPIWSGPSSFKPVAYAPERRELLLVDNAGGRSRIIRVRAGRSTIIYGQASALTRPLPALSRRIDYRSAAGERQSATLLLPPDYKRGRKYPTLVWLYPGLSYSGQTPTPHDVNSTFALNMQVASSRGFAILFPSLRDLAVDRGVASIPDEVMPAVDAAVSSGYSDEQHLFAIGHSFGGYATMALLASTSRFRAAVSISGPTDLISMFGTFSGSDRYADDGKIEAFGQRWLEQGQGSMKVPYWVNPDRYIRNSPVFMVDRIRTPLLIMQGDMDYVPIQQGEEMFSALRRLNRKVRFVRYWGEGHLPATPANIRDMWAKIFDWIASNGLIDVRPDGRLAWDGLKVRAAPSGP